ncbi:uncharacterized protein ACBT44_004334 isoform 1-T1 [Syngnathus typhle]
MEQDQERHLDVRPKRRTHPPAWMQDFEVDYVGYEHSGQPRWDSFTPTPTGRPSYPQQGLVQTISLRAPQFHPESFEDAAQHRAPQLASSFTRRRNADDRTLSAPVQSYQQQPNQDQYHPNRHTVQDGNAVLRETHEAIHAGLKELNKARSDLQQLIDVAHSLRIGMSQVNIPLPACSSPKPPDGAVTTSNSSRFTESEEEEDWPDPPPWPEPEEALNANLSALNLGAHQLPPYPTPPETKPLHYRPQPQPAQFRHPQFIPSSRESSHVPPVPPRNLPLPLEAPPTGQPHLQVPHSHRTTPYMQPPYPEPVYRGPQPTIPKFTFPDPSEFARLRIALENLLPSNATELFKYQVLVDHLKLEEAKLISDAYLNSPTPYTDTMTALYDKYGQPHQLALKKISSVLDGPEVRRGDPMAFQKFALQIQSLVGLLQTLGHEGEVELSCGSHVARLLSKLPPEQRADFRRSQPTRSGATSTLRDLSEWLRHESWCQDFDDPTSSRSSKEKQSTKWNIRPVAKQTAVLHSSQEPSVKLVKEKPVKGKDKSKVYCAYCESTDHYLSQCSGVAQLTKDELKRWIQEHKRCWRCARRHFAAQCDLKKPCNLCQGKHLLALHEINIRPEKVKDDSPPKAESCLTTCASESFYLDRPHVGNRVMLKVVRVHVHYGSQKLDTYAILDDGSERTMLLPTAAKSLALNGAPEDLPLRTVRSDIQVLHGHTVSFRVSSPTNPNIMFKITDAFTASHLNLAPHSYPVSHLQRKFKHLRGIPIPTFREVKPLLLIGSDQPHLVTPIEPVRLGPHGSPAAVRTRLGWTLQGPCQSTGRPAHPAQCLFTSVPPPMDDLYRHVERLWQVDTVPYRPEREVTRSKQDQQAIALLETKTGRTEAWSCWEAELKHLPDITMPRPYAPADSHREGTTRQVHIFADASEKAYGAVAFLRTEDNQGKVHLSFVLARSRIAPKRVHSVPRLELCAALVAAQLASTLKKELALPVHSTVLWSDSTTVLTWLHSQSCRYKVFVGSRVAEIQELTEGFVWRYVDSDNNPADDLTRGKTLISLLEPNRWSQGPTFLLQGPTTWPEMPHGIPPDDAAELRKGTFCGSTVTSPDIAILQDKTCNTWQELMDATARELHGQAPPIYSPTAEEYRQAEVLILQRAQKQSFPDDCAQLSAGKPVKTSSRLLTLAPVIDTSIDLIRVGGRLRRLEGQNEVTPHPIVLDASHPVTRLLIKKYDQDLKHPGPERVFAELRRTYWIIHGREAVRRYQRSCVDCQRWRAKPSIPKMADLPTARLQLHKPAFHATGMDCFGPMLVKVGRRHEKRWGLIFKCLTTRAVHLDLIRNMDTDAFLMALRRFIARRGTPSELWSDHGTNFKGGEKELREAFTSMCPTLQSQLAPRKIKFNFNPPAAPHFGGVWEREVRAVKSALRTCLGTEPIHEDVLSTVLLEVEAILNSKPLGYVSADLSDVDPVTPNSLLLGRPDGSLPQIVYPKSEILSRRRWRHSQVLADQFWSRFIRDYLPGLQTRQKWQASPPDLLEKSVVMITEPQLPRAMWPIGHVTKVHRSDDGHIRSADVDIKGRQYTRPVARLVVLPALPAEVTQDSHKD